MTDSISKRLIDAAEKWVMGNYRTNFLMEEDSPSANSIAAEAFKQLAQEMEGELLLSKDTISELRSDLNQLEDLYYEVRKRESLWRELDIVYHAFITATNNVSRKQGVESKEEMLILFNAPSKIQELRKELNLE